jgi:hypothetical protein
MATISENITRINQAKVDIKNAIIAKGGTVADSDKINVYAQAIEALPSGGDDETLKRIIDRSITKCNIPQGTTSIGGSAFNGCTSLTSVTIPDSVTTIGSFAFYECSKLTSVTIPDSVTTISGYAFDVCSKLRTITVKATTPPSLSSNAIPSNVTTIYVPSSSVNAYKSASGWNSHASKIQAIQG